MRPSHFAFDGVSSDMHGLEASVRGGRPAQSARRTRKGDADLVFLPAPNAIRTNCLRSSPARRRNLKEELSPSEGRRIALTAQGFNGMARAAEVGAAALRSAIDRLGLLQIDSVNVLVARIICRCSRGSASTTALCSTR